MKYTNNVFVLCLVLSACSGAPVQKVEVEEPQFKVLEAAPGGREAWLDNPYLFAQKEGLDVENYLFYTGEESSADKRLACESAQANVIDDIAKQVSTFVDTSIAKAASEGRSSDTSSVSSSSAVSTQTSKLTSQLTKTVVHGVDKKRQYWEKRDYSQVGGAKSNYTCWVLGAIKKEDARAMIDRAKIELLSSDRQLKQKVESKLNHLAEDFEKFKEQ